MADSALLSRVGSASPRLRIVPSRGRSWFVWDPEEARLAAEACAVANDTSVAVVEAPERSLVRMLYVISAPVKAKGKQRG